MVDDLDDLTLDLDEGNEIPLQPIPNREELVYSEEKNTLPIMTMYEFVDVIIKRIEQLNLGFKSTIEDVIEKEKIVKSYDIAMREFNLGKIPPYSVKRVLPNGTYELWRHEDFSIYPN